MARLVNIVEVPKGNKANPFAYRIEWLRDNPEVLNYIYDTAKTYGIDPSVLATRVMAEGAVDRYIRESRRNSSPASFLDYPSSGHHDFGLDTVDDRIRKGAVVPLQGEAWDRQYTANESGRKYWRAEPKTMKDGIGLTAATLKALYNTAQKDFPSFTPYDLSRVASAYYNRGEAGGRRMIKNNSNFGYHPENEVIDMFKEVESGRAEKASGANTLIKAENALRNTPVLQLDYNRFDDGGQLDGIPPVSRTIDKDSKEYQDNLKRQQVLINAGYTGVVADGSWGPYQEELWDRYRDTSLWEKIVRQATYDPKYKDGLDSGLVRALTSLYPIENMVKPFTPDDVWTLDKVREFVRSYNPDWTDAEIKQLHDEAHHSPWGAGNALYAMAGESGFRGNKSAYSSAVGLGQLTDATLRSIYPNDADYQDARREYDRGTRSISDQITDLFNFRSFGGNLNEEESFPLHNLFYDKDSSYNKFGEGGDADGGPTDDAPVYSPKAKAWYRDSFIGKDGRTYYTKPIQPGTVHNGYTWNTDGTKTAVRTGAMGKFIDKVKTDAEAFMHSSSSPFAATGAGWLNILAMNQPANTGIYYAGDKVSQSVLPFTKKSPVDRGDYIRAFLYGDFNGMNRSKEVPLERRYATRQFTENFIPVDTLKLSPELKPLVEGARDTRIVMNNNHRDLYSAEPYRGRPLYNASDFTGYFTNQDGQDYFNAYDYFDFDNLSDKYDKTGSELKKFLVDVGEDAVNFAGQRTERYPQAGPFMVRQDKLPIKWDTSGRDDNLLKSFIKEPKKFFK